MRETIVTEFEPPKGMSPLLVGILVDGMLTRNDIMAGFLNLVVNGILKINQKKPSDENFGYRAFLTKDVVHIEDSIDRKLAEVLLSPDAKKNDSFDIYLRLSQIEQLSGDTIRLWKVIEEKMVELGFWKENPYPQGSWGVPLKRAGKIIGIVILISLPWATYLALYGNFATYVAFIFIWLFFSPFFLILNFTFQPFIHILSTMKSHGAIRTEKGELTQRHLLGFRDYYRTAQKDRSDFQYKTWGDVEKNPNLFLYAVALGMFDPFIVFLPNKERNMREFVTGKKFRSIPLFKIGVGFILAFTMLIGIVFLMDFIGSK